MAKKLTLGKNERLKSRKQIESLFSTGKKFTVSPFRVTYLVSKLANPPLLFGVGVSSRNFKKAVDRNRIKRLVKEAYRLQKTFLYQKLAEQQNQLTVFIIYTGKEVPQYKEVFDTVNTILDKLDHLVELKT